MEARKHVEQVGRAIKARLTLVVAVAAAVQAEMLRVKWGVVLMDESHNITTISSGRGVKENAQTMAARELAAAAARVVLMSGTPSLSRPFDLFNQVCPRSFRYSRLHRVVLRRAGKALKY
jgi:hypothetical protein